MNHIDTIREALNQCRARINSSDRATHNRIDNALAALDAMEGQRKVLTDEEIANKASINATAYTVNTGSKQRGEDYGKGVEWGMKLARDNGYLAPAPIPEAHAHPVTMADGRPDVDAVMKEAAEWYMSGEYLDTLRDRLLASGMCRDGG